MKLIFEQTREDIQHFTRYSMQANNSQRYIWIVLGVAALILLFTISREGVTPERLISWAIPLVILGVLWYFLFRYMRKRMLDRPDNAKLLYGKRVIVMGDDELIVETPTATTNYQWAAITSLGEDAANYYLHLAKAQAIIVPKRVFPTGEERRAFLDLVGGKVAVA